MIRYRANAYCPKCQRQPATRFYQAAVEDARRREPDEPIEDVVCTRCGTTYLVSAFCLQTAEADVGRHKVLDAGKKAA